MPNRQTIVRSAPNWVTLSWTAGGGPPYQVFETASIVAPNWQKLGNPTLAKNKEIAATGSAKFFRVQEQVVMTLDAEVTDNETKLFWDAPEPETSDAVEMPPNPYG